MNTHTPAVLVLSIIALTSTHVFAGKGDGGDPGTIIIDMTANPGDVAIDVNLDFVSPGKKGETAIPDGYGINAINIEGFHVLSRDTSNNPNELKLSVGRDPDIVNEDQFGTNRQLSHFAQGEHLFDLDRLRTAADWMSTPGNLQPDGNLPSGTYGSISFSRFLRNIQLKNTMYGFVRVKIPLQLGTCTTAGNCDKNAKGEDVVRTSMYGFCESNQGLCSCAPYAGYKIVEGDSNCGWTLPDTAQIRVKGSLLWDFVASEDNPDAGLNAGDAIPLDLLPWAPRELYFKVEIPIMVNWIYDTDLDGAMENMFNIKNVSAGGTDGNIANPNITWAMVAPSNKVEYLYYTGDELTESVFNTLDNASRYHLMMPTGYPDGWAEAFNKLNITGAIWQNIPVNPHFRLPPGYADSILTSDVVRSPMFEDIPTYLYSGGLIDMHDHVNISGLVYVPQGMELEAKNSSKWSGYVGPTRQYINGAVIVRDTFYIEAKDTTITVISSDPTTYSTASVTKAFAGTRTNIRGFSFVQALADRVDDAAAGEPPPPEETCLGGCDADFSTGSASAKPPGANRWMELRPEIDNGQ